MAKKNELVFLLQDYDATVDNGGSLSIDASYEIDGIEENAEVPIEFQMIVESGKHKYNASPSDVRMLSRDENSFYVSAYFDCDPDQLPDKFQIFYRIFSGKKSFVAEPNIANKKGGGSLSLPPTTMLGASKWTASSFSLNSIAVKNDDGDFFVEWTGSSTKHSDLYLNVLARSGSDESPGGLLIKSPAVTESFFINGSNKLSLCFDLYKAGKWQSIEKVSDLKFEHQESEEDASFSDDYDTEEVNAPESSAANGKDQDWKEVSERALNWYFNTVRKTDDIHEAEQMFMEEVTSALEDAGIEWNEFPYDISVDLLEQITSSLKKHLGSLKKEFPHFVEGILDPFHTYYDGLLYDYLQNDDLSNEGKDRVAALLESWSS